ncbi:hypothetical protein EW026_g5367 [Hermanssonia centrifuga]|uniref:BD-FAE-like domain-containing protein n=1 Tax=Hermanssonia centrifuga TaxID=98765 RepID=A0A4S4KEB8_9APHY|nr:hypothetical protein EW026_g5367 [Hermanssonia centrifuga]
MEAIKELPRDIVASIGPTLAVFLPLVKAHESEISGVKHKTFKYGATERHQLDVYFPSGNFGGKAPVLFFVYGGGLMSGDRVFEPPADLFYRNVGAFFAKQGIVTVIADYRLYPHIKFPDPAEDIRDAMVWFVSNIDEVNKDVSTPADVDNIFIRGHSAGGAVAATLVLMPDLLPQDLRPRIKGLILQAGVYHFRDIVPLNPDVTSSYYGNEVQQREREPLGLVERAPENLLRGLSIITMIAEYDPPEYLAMHQDITKALNEKLGTPVQEIVMQGHNHISPNACLYSGEGEGWAFEVAEWVKVKSGI